MRIPSTIKWALVVGFVAVAAGTAAAQPAAGGGANNATSQVPFQKKTSLTPEEQLAEGTKHIARMEGAGNGVRKMLMDARKQRDVVKTLCINDKLSQIDVAIRSGKERQSQLGDSVKRKDVDLSNHHYTIITVLRQRTEQLVAEANQCIGEESAFVGDTKTIVQIDPQIPPDEAPYPVPPTDPIVVIGPPQCTSCTE
jgi:hypothetical protein